MEGIIMIGEIGGIVEEEVVEFIRASGIEKLIVFFIAGFIVFLGRCMGYVGVIILGGKGSVGDKIVVFECVGVCVVKLSAKMG